MSLLSSLVPSPGRSLAGVGNTPLGSVADLFPLAVSADGRWLEYADGSPLHVNGDTAWSIFAQLSLADAATYLADRAAKGVNLILASFIEHAFSDQTPAWENVNGDAPFGSTLGGGELDFTDPVEAYWSHVDAILGIAESHGITVLALPAYVGFNHGTEGWGAEIAANGATNMATYGTFLGQRYASQPNLIWSMGGDAPAVVGGSNLTDDINALANAIKAADPNHLMTAHSQRGRSSLDDYDQTWLDLNASYGDDSAVHIEVRTSRQAEAMPTFLIEARYGNEHSMTAEGLRAQMYQAVLGGGFGHIYGNAPTWYLGRDATHPADDFADTGGLDWEEQLDSFAADDLVHVARLQAARDLSALAPDYSHVVVTAGYDPDADEGVNYAPVMAGSQVLVAYTRGNALTVDRTQFTAGTYHVRWYSPRDGTTTDDDDATMGSGSEQFTPPDANDWVLLIDDQALGLGAP